MIYSVIQIEMISMSNYFLLYWKTVPSALCLGDHSKTGAWYVCVNSLESWFTVIYFRLDCDSGLCGYCLQLLSTSTVCSNQYVLVFFPFALISSFNLLPSLHYLIVIAVRLSDDIDNANYATLTCSATAGNQISHFPIAFLLIIAVLPH